MGLFSFLTQEIAIDLGTANTIIIHNDKIVVDEPSIVAVNAGTQKLIAIGEKARQMHGKTHEDIKTIRPLRDGVIADFDAAEKMIRGMIKMINNKTQLFSPALKIVICIPSGSTEVEIRAVRDSSEHAGGREVLMIWEPMAAAIGMGVDVEAPEGSMVVDIGGGTTEIAVISLGGIVSNQSIRIAGDDFTADIREYMRHQHNIKIGERTAEDIKINVGSALPDLEDAPADYRCARVGHCGAGQSEDGGAHRYRRGDHIDTCGGYPTGGTGRQTLRSVFPGRRGDRREGAHGAAFAPPV